MKGILRITKSVKNKIIYLTYTQWYHIIESHDYMAGNIDVVMETINSPDCIVKGRRGEFLAIRYYPHTNLGRKYCVGVYKENKDNFIITAFLTSKPERIKKRGLIWQK